MIFAIELLLIVLFVYTVVFQVAIPTWLNMPIFPIFRNKEGNRLNRVLTYKYQSIRNKEVEEFIKQLDEQFKTTPSVYSYKLNTKDIEKEINDNIKL